MNLFAKPDDLTSNDWLSRVPDNADTLLRAATVLVAVAAGRNAYDPPPAGPVVDALRDATCAQVAAWVNADIDPSSGAAGDPALLKRTDLFEGKLEYDTAALAEARKQAIKELCGEAAGILRMTGLLVEALPLFDTSGALPSWGLDSPQAYRWPRIDSWPLL